MSQKTKQNKTVSIEALWEYEKVNRTKENENHLLINIIGGDAPEDESRKPVALQGVIDCSGSMGGDKIEKVRKTLTVLVDHLTDQDYLGLTAYSNSVWEICPITKCDKNGKDLIKKRIREEVRSTSMTNMAGGFLEGVQALQSKDFGDKYLQRVLLLTDGLANVGIIDHQGLVDLVKKYCDKNSHITLSTFGYGSGDENIVDFNPEVLTSMAKVGRGNYHHISSPDKVPGALGSEIGGLLSCVAQNIKLSLRLNDGVNIIDVLNDYDVKTEDKITTINVDDIYAQEERNIVIKLSVPKMSKSVARPVKVLDVEVKYFNTINSDSESIKEPIKLNFVKSGDESIKQNEKVEKEIALLEAASAQEEANNLADKNDYDGAKNCIQRGIESIRKCSTYSKDTVLQRLADGLENLKPRYEFGTYGLGTKGYASSNVRMLRTKRAVVGGDAVLGQTYSNIQMFNMADSFSAAVDNEDANTGGHGYSHGTFITTTQQQTQQASKKKSEPYQKKRSRNSR